MRRLIALLLAAIPALADDDRSVPPAEAAAKIALPEGFQATLFAGEPDLVQPISFTFDDRGRMWVVECLSYPAWLTEGPGRDRITIFEDQDGDGRFDRRKVFFDRGTNVSSLQLGFGGVWLCSVPNLVFIPDRNGDDVPDGPPEIKLDGWDLKAKHNVVNELQWGPDGWLYGCNGILSNSRVGKPGTPDAQRVPLNCGVWRYHPTRQSFEVVAWGTTNPWGLDFDDYGEAFITNCVIHHLWHVVPGAHFERMFGQDLNPNAYGLLPSCADYIHWGGGPWQGSRGGEGIHDKPGGGHAHSGAMIYLGDNWPAKYRNHLFTCNIHGRRVNVDRLTQHKSGYQAERAPDFLSVDDPWFRGLAMHTGPDGGVFLSDWSDTGECHDYDDIQRGTGRIFKITYGKPATAGRPVNVAALSDVELVQLQLHPNDWFVRQSRRVLQERAAAGKLSGTIREPLVEICESNADVRRRLRAMWALFAIGEVDESVLTKWLEDRDPHVRSWAVRLLLEDVTIAPELLPRLAELARREASPKVRLALASALQRLPIESRWDIAAGLVAHAEDEEDARLPLMIWYGIEPLAGSDRARAAQLIARSKLSKVREFLARRIATQ